jgi:hypothetical protein
MTTGDQTFAEKKIDAIWAAWNESPRPDDPKWAGQYAQAAIAAGLPCFDATGRDLGPDGWREWAAGDAANSKTTGNQQVGH